MEPVTTAATGMTLGKAAIAAAPIVASGISSAFNMMQQNSANRMTRDLANTAHQREVRDLRKAGLNPILSARLGGSATPPQSAAQMADLGPSAAAGLRANAEIEQIKASAAAQNSAARLSTIQGNDINATQVQRVDLLLADAQERLADANLSGARKLEVMQQIQNLKAQRAKIQVETASSAADLEAKNLKSKMFRTGNELLEGKFPSILNPQKKFFERNFKQQTKPKKGERDFRNLDEPSAW